MPRRPRPIVLTVLDGWGYRAETKGNAIALARKPNYDELLRKLREDEALKPSTRVSGDRLSSSAIAEARSTESRQLIRILRGDLDWITMKALEKDRARRYGAPSDLAADIRGRHD